MIENINNLIIWRMWLNLNFEKQDEKKSNKNEMYSNKYQIILALLCNRITLYSYMLYL